MSEKQAIIGYGDVTPRPGLWAEVQHWQRSAKLKEIVAATFPGYRRRSVYLRPETEVELHDLSWGGGTRNEYRAVKVDGDTVRSFVWGTQVEGAKLPIPPGVVIVQGGTFCGKQATLYLHVNAEDMAKHLAVQA